MNKTKNKISFILLLGIFSTSLFLTSCSNKPSEEEMLQLTKLRAEIAELELQINAKEKEKFGLESLIKEKEEKLKQIQDEIKSAQNGTK